MKKHLKISVVLALFAISLSAAGQQPSAREVIKKGSYNFSPQLLNLGFNAYKMKVSDMDDEDTKVTQFGLALAGGYTIMDGLTLNGQVGTQYFKLEDMKTMVASVGVNARYYLPMNLFVGVGTNFNYLKLKGDFGGDFESDYDIDMEDTNYSFLDVNASLGYAIFISSNVALEPAISYRQKVLGGKIKDTDHKINYSGFGFNLGVSIFF